MGKPPGRAAFGLCGGAGAFLEKRGEEQYPSLGFRKGVAGVGAPRREACKGRRRHTEDP